MDSSATDQQLTGGKDLLQQALDIAALTEEECRSPKPPPTEDISADGFNERVVSESNTVSVEQTIAYHSIPPVQTAISAEVKPVQVTNDSANNRVTLNIPKIPSVVVRNENNDIIEQVNELDNEEHLETASASVRQTLKSKIMEKSKCQEKIGENVTEGGSESHESQLGGMSGDRSPMSVSVRGEGDNADSDVPPTETDFSQFNVEGNFSQFNVKMPPKPQQVEAVTETSFLPGQNVRPHFPAGVNPLGMRPVQEGVGVQSRPTQYPGFNPRSPEIQPNAQMMGYQQMVQARMQGAMPVPEGGQHVRGAAPRFHGSPAIRRAPQIPYQPGQWDHGLQNMPGFGPYMGFAPQQTGQHMGVASYPGPHSNTPRGPVGPSPMQQHNIPQGPMGVAPSPVLHNNVPPGAVGVAPNHMQHSSAPHGPIGVAPCAVQHSSTPLGPVGVGPTVQQSNAFSGVMGLASNALPPSGISSNPVQPPVINSGVPPRPVGVALNPMSPLAVNSNVPPMVSSASQPLAMENPGAPSELNRTTTEVVSQLPENSAVPTDTPVVNVEQTGTEKISQPLVSGAGLGIEKTRDCESPMLNQFVFYSCDKCAFKTRIRQNFRKHYSQHLSYKPYSCNFCKFRTYGKCYMPNHMKVHSGEDQKGFLYFPDPALDKAIEFHCDDCKVEKWVNDAELEVLKKDVLAVQQKFSALGRKMQKKEEQKREKEEIMELKRKEDGKMKKEGVIEVEQKGVKRKREDDSSKEVKVKKKPGKKSKNVTEEGMEKAKEGESVESIEQDLGKKINDENEKKEEDVEKKTKYEHEDSDTEEDEPATKKKIPNYEIVDATNILETPKRKRKFKTLFDPSPEVSVKKTVTMITEGKGKGTMVTTNVNKLKCPFCPYKTESPLGLRRHGFWRHNMCEYHCDNCSFKAKTKEEVMAHYRDVHPKMNPIVNRTIMKMNEKSAAKKNEKAVAVVDNGEKTDEGEFEDTTEHAEDEVKEEVNTTGSVEKMEEDQENDNESKEEGAEVRTPKHRAGKFLPQKFLYKCTECDYKSNMMGVQRHLLRSHDICRFMCSGCDFESTERVKVEDHQKTEHPDQQTTISRGFVDLGGDNKQNISVSHSKKSRKSFQIKTLKRAKDTFRIKQIKLSEAKRNTPSQCPVCDFKSLYSGVQRHIFMFHSLGKWQCGRCGIELYDKATTIEHSFNMHKEQVPQVIRSFMEVEKVKELMEQNAIIVEKNGNIKIVLAEDGNPVHSPIKQLSHDIAPVKSPPVKEKKEKDEFIKDTQCPECKFMSNLKGVQRHLLMIHKICRWQCKHCGFESPDKSVAMDHSQDMHEGIEPKILRAFVDLDRYIAEKRFNESMDMDLGDTIASDKYFDFSEEEEEDDIPVKKVPESPSKQNNSGSKLTTMKKAEQGEIIVKKAADSPSKPSKASSKLTALKKAKVEKSPVSVADSPRKAFKTRPDSPRSTDGLQTTHAKQGKAPSPRLEQSPLGSTWEKKKPGRPKGSRNKTPSATNKHGKDTHSTFVLRPKELNLLQQGFSCVYCVYAAPLRHQVRLHCYDKHTNYPACLMEFKVDSQCFRGDDVPDASSEQNKSMDDSMNALDGKNDIVEKNSKHESEAGEVKRKDCDDAFGFDTGSDDEVRNGDIGIKTKDDVSGDHMKDKINGDMKDANVEERMNIENKENGSLDNFSENPDLKSDDKFSNETTQDMEVDELHISEIYENNKRLRFRKQRKKFDNPLKPLVSKLQTGRINLEDPFHGTLDEVDSILFQFGVRTLNMDMLTQQQFSNFISKFGADLQPA